ncbi:alkaline phosphatase family protein [Liquorilactobacillus satsumensis]|uniref:alkaline phosphatase family protein n=1 Tax=Liquorilactobacillus satsumensis TaxID=259059 RepID=UPI0039ECB1DE
MPLKKKILIAVIDGCATAYLSPQSTPHLFKLIQDGSGQLQTALATVPTVTNVNHARILTGSWPEENGINGNTFYDRATATSKFIQSSTYLKKATLFKEYEKLGLTSALLTVKGKVMEVFGDDATWKINAETPTAKALAAINQTPPPHINDPASGAWIFNSALKMISRYSPDLVYCTTNDYVMHHFAPNSVVANEYLQAIDAEIAKIHALEPDRIIFVTADHGMNAKNHLINLQPTLDTAGYQATCVLPMADRYLANHPYQEGGIAYLFCQKSAEIAEIAKTICHISGVEAVLTNKEAADVYHLSTHTIGDLVVLGDKFTVFGNQPQAELFVKDIRTHGSVYEQAVPLFTTLRGHKISSTSMLFKLALQQVAVF